MLVDCEAQYAPILGRNVHGMGHVQRGYATLPQTNHVELVAWLALR